jgi:hypothetical protein
MSARLRRRRWPGVVRAANARQTLPQRFGRMVVLTTMSTSEGNLVINYPTSKQGTIRRALAVLAMIAFALTLGLGATANAGTADQTSGHDKAVQRFAEQAKAAGLSDAQVSGLQAKVDAFLEKHRGTQVAPGRIQLPDGKAFVQMAVPGERNARDFSRNGAVTPQQSCPYYYFCAYRGGDVLSYYYCNDQYMPWTGYGSYVNNQTPGTRATFKNSGHGSIGTSCAAYCAVGSINWSPIYYIDPC